MTKASARRAALWLLALYAAFLAFILLGPSATVPTESVSLLAGALKRLGVSASIATLGRVEFVSNVLIIVPLSLLGSVVWPRLNWRDWAGLGFVLAGSVELFQAVFLAARSASFTDLAANTLGACLGALLYRQVPVRN